MCVEIREGDEDEKTICVVRNARLYRFSDCRRSTSFSQFQPQPEFFTVSHLCLGFQQCQPGPESILAQVAQQDIDSALQAKGWQKVQESDNSSVIVTANGGLKQQTSYSAWGMRGIGGGMGSITPEQNVIGTLVVDLYDAKNQSLIWRGIAQNTLNNNGNKNQQMVQKAVTKMFKQWPPV
jgi:hypothetical protein